MKQTTRRISLFTLIMFITGSIDSIRNLPATALFGTNLLFFFVLSAFVFLIPIAIVSAELSTSNSTENGVYNWVQQAFGEKTAVLAIWLQWINTMVWYPTILSFLAGNIAFIINPQLALDKTYLISVILILFWSLTFLNLKGVQTSARFASICTVVGMVIPMALIFGLIAIWVIKGNPSQIHFTSKNLLPDLTDSESWVSLTAIMTAFLGLELSSVHVNEVDNPRKNFPRAMLISAIFILATMLFGALAIAVVLPKSDIHLVDGVMQIFTRFFQAYHLSFLIPVIAVMLTIGSLGEMINWMISPAKGLFYTAQHGYLPKSLIKTNQANVAYVILIIQAVMVSLVCLAFLLMPSVNGSYWLLTSLSTEIYVIMYLLMLLSAFRLRRNRAQLNIVKSRLQFYLISGIGLIGCIITLIVGFIPPRDINVGTNFHYIFIYSLGVVAMILPVLILYIYKMKRSD